MQRSTLAPIENRALSVAAAAAYCGIAAGTLRNRISLGIGPRVQRIGRRVLVRFDDLESWLASSPASVPRVARRKDKVT